MKTGDLYEYIGKPKKICLDCYEVEVLPKLFTGEPYTNNDFVRFTRFIDQDHVLITGEMLNIIDTYIKLGNPQRTWSTPIFLNLATMKRFIFKLNTNPEKILRKVIMEDNG